MLSLIYVLLLSLNVVSQDPLFFNTNQSLIYTNPSFAGTNGLIRNQFLYRNQWPTLSANYITYYNATDVFIKKSKSGLAFIYLHDDINDGLFKRDEFHLVYAQHIHLFNGKGKLIPSIQLGYFTRTLDRTKLNFGDWIESGVITPLTGLPPIARKSNMDFSAGLLFYYRHFYVGFSAFHFTQPDEGFLGVSKLPVRFSGYLSYNLYFNDKNIFQAQLNYQNQNNANVLIVGGNFLLFNSWLLGAAYKNLDGIVLRSGYRQKYFSLQLGYDVVVSKLSGNTAGSWELSASFNLRNKEERGQLLDMERW
ncbi:MAG: PorP/SprF family type IX secretion system membrane protein [Bacteroidetes bacterium]|nr:PorP/SprF family type IX secretion system membrane protein [Bacteroidota bacterium]